MKAIENEVMSVNGMNANDVVPEDVMKSIMFYKEKSRSCHNDIPE